MTLTDPSARVLCMSMALVSLAGAQTSIFSVRPSPNPSVHGSTFNAVAAISANDARAVGFEAQNEPYNGARTLAAHWDGTRWSATPTPNPNPNNCSYPDNALTGVAAFGPNDVWAVGFHSSCTDFNPLILHWNGQMWRLIPSPQLSSAGNNVLNGIAGASAKDIYAVGYQAQSNGASTTLVEHFDGTRWSVVATPSLSPTGNVLSGVFATSSNDVWAVGNAVDITTTSVATQVLHFDGNQWSIVPSPNPLPLTFLNQNVLLGVTASGPTDATAVGFALNTGAQRELTLIEHWNGENWSIVLSPNQSRATGSLNTLNSVAAVSGSDIYAAGFFGDAATSGQHETLVEHFDGAVWHIIPSPKNGVAQHLNGAAAVPGTSNLWLVGAFSTNGDDPETGLLIVPQTYVLFTPIA
jgi:hypothetical protein